MPATVAGTFSTGGSSSLGQTGGGIIIQTGITSMKLTTVGLDASNTIKTQKRTTPGGTFADQTTYNSDQTNLGITVAAGEEWRVVQVAQQATKDVRWKLTQEN